MILPFYSHNTVYLNYDKSASYIWRALLGAKYAHSHPSPMM